MSLRIGLIVYMQKLDETITQSKNLKKLVLTSLVIGIITAILTILLFKIIVIIIATIISIFVFLQIWHDKIKVQTNWMLIISSISVSYIAVASIYLIILITNH